MSNNTEKYKVKAGEHAFEMDAVQAAETSIYKEADGSYSIIKDFKSRDVKILDVDETGRQMKVDVDGEIFTVKIETPLEQRLHSMGLSATQTRLVKDVKAPMPGLVLRVDVQEGDAVKEGDKLLILEAMKMENSIMIHADAVIKKVNVKPGDAVEKNQVLVELE